MDENEVVLLVENEPDYASLVKDALACAHIQNPVYVVETGEEAVAYLGGKRKYADRYIYPFPSLVLLDLRMSGMGGFGVLRWLCARPELKEHLDVIVLSASRSTQEIEVAYELGALAFLTKSADNTELWELIEYLKENLLAGSFSEVPSVQLARSL